MSRALHTWVVMVVMAVFAFASGCSKEVADSQSDRFCVTVAPLAEMVERIAGPGVTVDVLVGPGQSPATYEPLPTQMAVLEQTQILFGVGVPFERAVLPRVRDLNADLRIIDLSEGLDLLTFDQADCQDHDHGHQHGSLDPHVWLDPQLMKEMASEVAERLVQLSPESTVAIQNRLQAYHQNLDSLDMQMAAILAGLSGKRMYVYHPSFGYFAKRYGLIQVPVELDGKEPSARLLAQFKIQAREDRVTVVFVQPQFSNRSATALAESIDAQVVELDPLARDYNSNMLRIAHVVSEALRDVSEEDGDGE